MYQILFLKIIVFFLIIVVILLLLYFYNLRKKMKHFITIFTEIETGRNKQRFLQNKNDVFSKIGNEINGILYKYEKQIEELNIALISNKQLMTSLSHDIRASMATLIGYLDAINMQLVKEEKREEYLRQASAKAYDMKNFIDVLFDWFRLNSMKKLSI